MSALQAEARRMALGSDILAALDFAESVYRGLEKVTPSQVALDADTHARLTFCAKSVYEGACRMRQLLDGAA